MIFLGLFHDIFNSFFLVYGLILFGSYILIGILSSMELSSYTKKNSHFRFHTIEGYKTLPSVSVIAPCYNEEKSIVQNIRSLLLINYAHIEIIVVNDGSSDHSLQKAIENYDLVRVDLAYDQTIKTELIRGIYKSSNKAYSNLIVIDKDNGGKADALNSGINISKSDLFLSIDVDCIIEPDAVYRMVKPFLEQSSGKKVIASGGVIRVANSCEIEDGQIKKVVYPSNLWARFQVLEYFRAFTLGRMAWSKINGLLIISGAFGMFDRELAQVVGGYDRNTVGEDLELVVRMRKYMHTEVKQDYQVAFIPDPLCWTEVPSDFNILWRQRNRWTRGSIETVIRHRTMFFNPKYGRIGMLSFPFWVFFEWLAPIFEVIGIIYFLTVFSFGDINQQVFFLLLALIFAFAFSFSLFAILFETFVFNRYKGYKFLIKAFYTAIIEMIIFHPLNLFFALSGNFDYFFRKNKKGWGVMTRSGFDKKKQDD